MGRIIVTRNVKEYRATVPVHVSREDTVLEIGCGEGVTSSLLHRYAGQLVAIDKSIAIEKTRKRYPHIRFERLDGFDLTAIRSLGLDFNKIYIDISGSRQLRFVVQIIEAHEAVFQPDLIVVKSKSLADILERAEVWR